MEQYVLLTVWPLLTSSVDVALNGGSDSEVERIWKEELMVWL